MINTIIHQTLLANNSYAVGCGSVTENTGITVTGNLRFTNDQSIIQAGDTKIAVSEVIELCKLMKRVMIDVGKDEELSRRLPYIKEAAEEWLMQELTK